VVAGDHVGQVDATLVPRFAGPATFARLRRLDEVSSADVVIAGVPFDSGVSYRPGARFGPVHVRASSKLIRPYNPAAGIAPFAALQVADAGDIAVNSFDITEAISEVEAGARAAIAIVTAGANATRQSTSILDKHRLDTPGLLRKPPFGPEGHWPFGRGCQWRGAGAHDTGRCRHRSRQRMERGAMRSADPGPAMCTRRSRCLLGRRGSRTRARSRR
jgi:hypothetical protein